MRKIEIAFLLFILIGLTACAVKNKSTIKELPEQYQHFDKVQKSGFTILTYQQEYSPKYPERLLEVVIIEETNNAEIFNNRLRSGKLEWIDDSTLKIYYLPGNPEKGKIYFYLVDLKTQSITNCTALL